tara:strand:- start:195 stop:326 length:132 start_codon:yes stop_codon:yes gene_type:complete
MFIKPCNAMGRFCQQIEGRLAILWYVLGILTEAVSVFIDSQEG